MKPSEPKRLDGMLDKEYLQPVIKDAEAHLNACEPGTRMYRKWFDFLDFATKLRMNYLALQNGKC